MKAIRSNSQHPGTPRVLTLALASAGLLSANLAWGASFTLTSQADWATGVYTNTNSAEPPIGHVKLNESILTPFNHIWVALSGRDGAARINTNVNPALIGDGNSI